MSSKISRPKLNDGEKQAINALKDHVAYLRTELLNAQQSRAMISPPSTVSGLTVHRTVGEDMKFGRCTHALQMLPNNTVLLLVTMDGSSSTFLLGEECSGFTAEKSMIETLDASPQS